ncbi:hypothetical protein [Streptomyces sp. NPDC127190]|uniref:hypothetical protein n=1 Tax=unclassified Streptomyces TaxID=2593676 RepID=UPI003626992F
MDIILVRVAAYTVAFTVIGSFATVVGVLASRPVTGDAAPIVWALVGIATAVLLGVGIDHLTTRILHRVPINAASTQPRDEGTS